MALIDVEGVSHRFADGRLALHNLTLSIERGEFLLICGRNGSGKSVLMKHLNGLLEPTAGRVHLDGVAIQSRLTEVRQRIGLVFQDADSQFVGQTVREDVAFGPENLRCDEAEVDGRIAEALSRMGLESLADVPPHRLSGGEKRRLAIAGVLAMRPEVVILDEPFAGLDYPGVRQVLDAVVGLHRKGTTIVVITHEIEKVAGHATRMVLMDAGCIVGDGAPSEVLEQVERFGVRKPPIDERGIGAVTWLT